MSSGGNEIDNFLRVVRVQIDALHTDLENALQIVPEGLRDAVRARYEEQVTQPVRRAHILSGPGGRRQWFEDWDPSEHFYWRQQRSYLLDRLGWSQSNIESLDDATDSVLAHLEDPRESGPSMFNVRGLVMGYVQSGKTANFCALIAKAGDLGYRLVIVLSGIHNSLRRQTQIRVNRAMGLDPSGVPLPPAGRRWISLTSAEENGDFNPGSIDATVLQGNERVLLVTKKNATVLRRLTQWISSNNVPDHLPVLVIDDEADQASINTGGNRSPIEEDIEDESDLASSDIADSTSLEEELDPSVINGLIRTLLSSFSRVSFVAYTATPFANVLINHLGLDRIVYQDLYPKDFIVTLPRPYGYTGAERLFGRDGLPGEEDDQPGLDVIKLVPDLDRIQLTPPSRDIASFIPVVVPSLRNAVLDFVIAIAARRHRNNGDFHSTMLVHVHHRLTIQNQMGRALREYLSVLRQSWRYDRDSIRPQLQRRWEEDFRSLIRSENPEQDCVFEEIEEHLDALFRDPIPVVVLNSESTDELDYDSDPNFTAVVIGGNRLSRGLTLEGLLVSYYVRRTQYFDSLLQMARWFGFREDYVDLTRIHTTEELSGWFRDLALAEEELRREIQRYEDERLTPLDFGPRIRCHPTMMITARNKMGSARFVSQDYSSHLLQTTAFRLDDHDWLQRNLDTTSRFVAQLVEQQGHPSSPSRGPNLPTWDHVDFRLVLEYLTEYQLDHRSPYEMAAICQYIQAQTRRNQLREWHVSIRGRTTTDPLLGDEPLLTTNGTPIPRIRRTKLRSTNHSIGSLVNPSTRLSGGDEEVGLTDEQIETARRQSERSSLGYPLWLRRQRSQNEGLLLIYPISPFSRPPSTSRNREQLFERPEEAGCTVVGIALSFPSSDSDATIEYAVGSVGLDLDEESL